eukprot:GHVU01091049.1.p1 GENE.GHVU01091049.1~~GHVU01091049.1.p1  ORF type:complete len:122 (-),score=2.73 GHVU01091049.1:382-747(-)
MRINCCLSCILLRVDLSPAGEDRVLTAYQKVAAEWTNIITESLKKQSLLLSPDAKREMRARVDWTGRVNVGEQCGGVVADAHMSTRTVCRHIWSTSICTISSQYPTRVGRLGGDGSYLART